MLASLSSFHENALFEYFAFDVGAVAPLEDANQDQNCKSNVQELRIVGIHARDVRLKNAATLFPKLPSAASRVLLCVSGVSDELEDSVFGDYVHKFHVLSESQHTSQSFDNFFADLMIFHEILTESASVRVPASEIVDLLCARKRAIALLFSAAGLDRAGNIASQIAYAFKFGGIIPDQVRESMVMFFGVEPLIAEINTVVATVRDRLSAPWNDTKFTVAEDPAPPCDNSMRVALVLSFTN